ncbi:MAG: hypothetical protein IVW57_10920 [Ktedonobacterales bacterium]|nr:hypothetical protein [Ktedonobacterales bacterium]
MYNTPRNYSSPTSLGIDERWERVLCYAGLWLSGLIMLLLEQRNQNVRQHAKQSIVVFGVLSLVAWVLSSFGGILGWIPILGFVFSTIIGLIHGLVIVTIVVLWITFMLLALTSSRTHVIGRSSSARY